jgi:hypothetical protein
MLPGFSAELMPKGREKESSAKIKRYMTMMDSMTNEGEPRPFFLCGFAMHVRHGNEIDFTLIESNFLILIVDC